MLLNFQKQFADAVRTGSKKQTIRARSKRTPRVGETAYRYTGLRTKQCQRLGSSRIIEVSKIHIQEFLHQQSTRVEMVVCIEKAGQVPLWLNNIKIKSLAQADGFSTMEDFFSFFRNTHGLPFEGYLIKWE